MPTPCGRLLYCLSVTLAIVWPLVGQANPTDGATPSGGDPAKRSGTGVQMVDVTFNVVAPPETGDADVVAMQTGIIFGANEQGRQLEKSGSVWTTTLSLPKGLVFRYEYYLNFDWNKQETYPYRRWLSHHREIVVTQAMTVTDTVGEWHHAPPTVDRSGRLSGVVSDSVTGRGIVGAIVSCGPYQTRTGYDGRYRIKGVPSGRGPVSVYLDDGAFRPQTEFVDVAAGSEVNKDFQLALAPMRRITFSASAPPTTPSGATIRMVGDREVLGLFGAYEGTALDSTRVIDLVRRGGRWEYTTSLGEGATIQYVYTLGDTFVGPDRNASGVTVRYVTVGGTDVTLEDAPENWKRPQDVPVTLNVTVPTAETTYVTGEQWGFNEPIKMWALGAGRWTYTWFASPDVVFNYHYVRDGDTNVGIERLSPDADGAFRSVSVGTVPVTRNDTVVRWRHQLQETLPEAIFLKAPLPIVPRTNGAPFITGLEFMDYWQPAWKPLIDSSAAFVASTNAQWAMVSPVWGILSADPPLIDHGWNSFPPPDLVEHIRRLKARGLRVVLFPQPYPTTEPYAGYNRPNTAAWYDEFFIELANCLTLYAHVAEAEHVEMIVIPSSNWYDAEEPHKDPVAMAKINERMKAIIATIRTIYHGKLSSSYFIDRAEYDWYGDLDYVGDIWWWPIAKSTSDTVEQMRIEALRILDSRYLPIYDRFKKPILMSSVAYYSADSSALQRFGVGSPEISPWGPETSTLSAWQQQADAFEAVYSAFGQRAWVQGGIVFGNWYFDVDEKGYSVRGKTAQHVLKLLYENLNSATLAASVTQLWPAGGSTVGGTVVTLTGANFTPGSTVTFGGLAATSVSVVNSTQITATVPAHAAATVDVVVTTTGDTAFVPGGYTYAALPTFSDDPLQIRTTPVKVAHLVELRHAIDLLRSRYALGPSMWTDTLLVPGTTQVKALHLIELRAALDAVFVATNQTSPTYAGQTLTSGATVITATHIGQLRAAVVAIWSP